MTEADLALAVAAVVGDVEGVTTVELQGSRQHGDASEFSDWDFVVYTNDFAGTAGALAGAVRALAPLAAQWDRLSNAPCFMLVLPGPVKVDLIFDGLTHEHEPPWTVDATTLPLLDTHFWDWTLWLASKVAAGKREVIDAELDKLHAHILDAMGAPRPRSVVEAVTYYTEARSGWERRLGVMVDHSLGDAVTPVVRRATASDTRRMASGDDAPA
jgi:hypothetical protein